ncbi:UNVERIFIED_ORG: hypothetical protein QOE_1890 [Clostridioides difficile F501]
MAHAHLLFLSYGTQFVLLIFPSSPFVELSAHERERHP